MFRAFLTRGLRQPAMRTRAQLRLTAQGISTRAEQESPLSKFCAAVYVVGVVFHVPFVFVAMGEDIDNWLARAAIAIIWGVAWVPLDALGGVPILGDAFEQRRERRRGK